MTSTRHQRGPTSFPRKSPGLLCAATAALFLALPGFSQTPQEQPSDFVLFGNFVLEVEGELVRDASLYHSPSRKGVLVRSPLLSSPVLVLPAGKVIQMYADEELVDTGTGSVRLLEGATPTSTTRFTLEDAGPRWEMDGKRVRLVANPPLLGAHDRAQVLEHDPAYRFKSEQYTPTPDHLRALQQFDGAVKVKVFFGSWCSVCAELMPGILKVDTELAASQAPYTFEYYGIPRDYKDPEVQQEGISSVPTAVVWVNGRRIGQINSASWRYPAMALRNIVYGVRSEVEQRLEELEVPIPPR